MRTVRLADAKAGLSDLVAKAAAGETVTITKHGRPVARLTGVEKPLVPVDRAKLESLTQTVPPQSESAGAFVRNMRDEDRY